MLLLIPLLPFMGFVVNAFLGRRLSKSVSGGIACLVMIAAFLVSVASAWLLLGHGGHAVEQVVFTWLSSGTLQIPFALRLDQLSALMLLVVTGIGTLIHIYAAGYMQEEPAVLPVLLVPEPVHVLHADPRPRRQLPA